MVDFAQDLTCGGHEDFWLRLKRMDEWNKAAVKKCVWNLFAKAGCMLGSLDSSNLRGRSFWMVEVP